MVTCSSPWIIIVISIHIWI